MTGLTREDRKAEGRRLARKYRASKKARKPARVVQIETEDGTDFVCISSTNGGPTGCNCNACHDYLDRGCK